MKVSRNLKKNVMKEANWVGGPLLMTHPVCKYVSTYYRNEDKDVIWIFLVIGATCRMHSEVFFDLSENSKNVFEVRSKPNWFLLQWDSP